MQILQTDLDGSHPVIAKDVVPNTTQEYLDYLVKVSRGDNDDNNPGRLAALGENFDKTFDLRSVSAIAIQGILVFQNLQGD